MAGSMEKAVRLTHTAWVVASKDMRLYYLRPGTLMFGVLFPLFLFFSFAVGRDLPVEVMLPALVAISLFFGSSSTGPMAIPTERKTKTYERLLVSPTPPMGILLGQTLGGFVFGLIFSTVPILLSLFWFNLAVNNVVGLVIAMALSSFAFSSLGIMFAALPTDNPGDVMMILNFVRLPLLFVSGLFIPLGSLGSGGLLLAAFSPLTYANDLLRWSMGGGNYFDPLLDLVGLLIFSIIFLGVGATLHERIRRKDLLARKRGQKGG
jgi:ABC-2 type transport system permease protein